MRASNVVNLTTSLNQLENLRTQVIPTRLYLLERRSEAGRAIDKLSQVLGSGCISCGHVHQVKARKRKITRTNYGTRKVGRNKDVPTRYGFHVEVLRTAK